MIKKFEEFVNEGLLDIFSGDGCKNLETVCSAFAKRLSSVAPIKYKTLSVEGDKIIELKFAVSAISQDMSDAKSDKHDLNDITDSPVPKKRVSSEHSTKINEVVESLKANAEKNKSNKEQKGKREDHKTIKGVNVPVTSVSNGNNYNIPNIIWRIILSVGLFAIILVLIPTVIGTPISIMIAKPGFESIWKGDCDIF